MTPRQKQEENKNWIVRLFKAMNANWASRIFSIAIIGLIISGYFLYLTKGDTKADCTKCEADKKVLVDVLLEVKQEMNNLAKNNGQTDNIHFNSGAALLLPYIDTLPKKKIIKRKTTPVQSQQQQVQVTAQTVIKKIDSAFKIIQQQQSQKPKQ